VLGPVAAVDGLVLAAGHVFGMLAGPVSGRLVAQQIVREPTDLDLHPFRYERDEIAGAAELQELRRW
jgi:glycine/D-amino acid oxidase-like deaminating enzyme